MVCEVDVLDVVVVDDDDAVDVEGPVVTLDVVMGKCITDVIVTASPDDLTAVEPIGFSPRLMLVVLVAAAAAIFRRSALANNLRLYSLPLTEEEVDTCRPLLVLLLQLGVEAVEAAALLWNLRRMAAEKDLTDEDSDLFCRRK